MRFAYIGAFRFPCGDAAASRVLNNGRLLRLLGHEVSYYSFGGYYREEDFVKDNIYMFDMFTYRITDDIDSHGLKEKISHLLHPGRRCCLQLISDIDSIDTIIVYNPSLYLNKWLIRFCQKNKKYLILDRTEWFDSTEFPGGAISPLYWLDLLNMRLVQKRIKNKILISSFLNNYYKGTNNIFIPPLISIEDKKWNGDIPFCMKELPQKDMRIICLSGSPPRLKKTSSKNYKNGKDRIVDLLEAFGSLCDKYDNIELIIAGVNEEQGKLFVANNKNYQRYKSKIVFPGKISQNAIPYYLKASNFSAIIRKPTRKNNYGFPTKLTESMAAGCPVLINNFGDLTAFIDDDKNAILFDGYSVDDIQESLEKVMKYNIIKLEEMKLAAKETGKILFDYHSYVDNMRNFINHLQ